MAVYPADPGTSQQAGSFVGEWGPVIEVEKRNVCLCIWTKCFHIGESYIETCGRES